MSDGKIAFTSLGWAVLVLPKAVRLFNPTEWSPFGAPIKPNLALKYGTRTEKHIFVKPSLFIKN
jgi:hypothetical protein